MPLDRAENDAEQTDLPPVAKPFQTPETPESLGSCERCKGGGARIDRICCATSITAGQNCTLHDGDRQAKQARISAFPSMDVTPFQPNPTDVRSTYERFLDGAEWYEEADGIDGKSCFIVFCHACADCSSFLFKRISGG
jgi:hypothetical protein